MADTVVENVSETVNPVNTQVENPTENGNVETDINPLLVPTNKTAEEIVAEIMSEVSDEGVRKSFEKMTQLEGELASKIETMQTSFTEKMTSIQEDIDKFWAIDKEYEKYHQEMDKLLDNSAEETLGSDQIKKMIKDFKEGNYKEGLVHLTTNGEAKSNNGVEPLDEKLGTSNSSPDASTEDVFDDASSETSESSVVSDPGKGKVKASPRTKKKEDTKGKGEDAKGKKITKKKSVKN